MIVILNYGVGNLLSIEQAFVRLKIPVLVSTSPKAIFRAQKIILPGVGSFGEAMRNLHALSLAGLVREKAKSGIPILGICLGMQLFFEESEEDEGMGGLGFIKGKVKKFPLSVKIPHLGWNQVAIKKIMGFPDRQYFYFAHSYFCSPELPDVIVGETDYGLAFPSIVAQGNLLGVQFHPEKSGLRGSEFLKWWATC